MLKKIVIPEGYPQRTFYPHEIICLQGDGSYTYIYVVDAKKKGGYLKITISYCLAKLERMLKPFGAFERVSKNTVINVHHLCAIGSDHTLKLHYDCLEIIFLSPEYAAQLSKHLVKLQR